MDRGGDCFLRSLMPGIEAIAIAGAKTDLRWRNPVKGVEKGKLNEGNRWKTQMEKVRRAESSAYGRPVKKFLVPIAGKSWAGSNGYLLLRYSNYTEKQWRKHRYA